MTLKQQWGKIKKEILKMSPEKQLDVIHSLYDLNKQNQAFIEARFLEKFGVTLEYYKKIINRYLYPDVMKNQDISLAKAKRAISDYKKATGDIDGVLELMLFYNECGHKCICDFGDMYESFYDSLISMFYNIIELLKKNPEYRDKFYSRMHYLAKESCNFGWGYDELNCAFREYEKTFAG